MRTGRIDKINFAKYVIVLLLLAYVIFLMLREGGNSVTIDTIEQNILQVSEMEGMSKANMQDFKKYYGLNAAEYDGVSLYIPDDVMSVSEVLVVKVHNKSQTEAIETAMEKRLQTQKKNFEGYGAVQTKLIESAVVKTKGYYVLLVISEDADEIEIAFDKSI